MRLGDIRVNVDNIGIVCENNGIYAIESELSKRTLYAENEGDFAIIQAGGCIRVNLEDVPKLAKELQAVYKECCEHEFEKKKITRRRASKYNVAEDRLLILFKRGWSNMEIEEELKIPRSYIAQRKHKMKEAGLL